MLEVKPTHVTIWWGHWLLGLSLLTDANYLVEVRVIIVISELKIGIKWLKTVAVAQMHAVFVFPQILCFYISHNSWYFYVTNLYFLESHLWSLIFLITTDTVTNSAIQRSYLIIFYFAMMMRYGNLIRLTHVPDSTFWLTDWLSDSKSW